MSLTRVNWETCSKRLSFFSRVHVSAQETALACTSVHTRCSDSFRLLQVRCWENRTDWNVSWTFVICFLTSLAAKKKKRKHTPPQHDLTKKGKKVAFPTWVHPGSWRQGYTSLIMFLRGNYPRLEWRQWWRLPFLVTCGLTLKCPGPPIRPDSCSELSSDWLAARQEPVGMQYEAPAPNPTETAGKGTANMGPLNPRCCPACSQSDTITGK